MASAHWQAPASQAASHEIANMKAKRFALRTPKCQTVATSLKTTLRQISFFFSDQGLKITMQSLNY